MREKTEKKGRKRIPSKNLKKRKQFSVSSFLQAKLHIHGHKRRLFTPEEFADVSDQDEASPSEYEDEDKSGGENVIKEGEDTLFYDITSDEKDSSLKESSFLCEIAPNLAIKVFQENEIETLNLLKKKKEMMQAIYQLKNELKEVLKHYSEKTTAEEDLSGPEN